MLQFTKQHVPAWSVAAVGAFFVATAVAQGPLQLHRLEEATREERGELSRLKETHLQAADNHIIADSRAASADTMGGLIEQFGVAPFRLARTEYHIRGAILAMWASTGETDDSEVLSLAQPLLGRLSDGDLNAYNELNGLLNGYRLESFRAIGAVATQIAESERRIQWLEQQLARVRSWQAAMNVIGLVIVLLAELPIWKRPPA